MSAVRVLAFALFIVVRAASQDASKVSPVPQEGRSNQSSPPAQAQCKFSDGKTITVDYSSPRMRGRKIFGNLVPYGEVWRTGANEATTFVTNENLITVKGTSVPAGDYTIFTVPNPDKLTTTGRLQSLRLFSTLLAISLINPWTRLLTPTMP
jgi:Protein of unknown function (DUF2911)